MTVVGASGFAFAIQGIEVVARTLGYGTLAAVAAFLWLYLSTLGTLALMDWIGEDGDRA